MKPVTWRAADGVWHQGLAPAAAVDTFLESRADHRERGCLALALDLGRDIDKRFTALFDGYDTRVPDFAEWVFDWETSYDRYYDVIRFAGLHLYDNLQRGEFGLDTEVIKTRIADEMVDTFAAIVIRPDETKGDLAALEADMAAQVAREIERIRADDAARLAGFLALGVTETATAVPPPNPEPPGPPDRPPPPAVLGSLGPPAAPEPFVFQTGLTAMAPAFVLDDELTESMLMRTPRPVLARFLGMGIRIAAGISIWRIAREFREVTDLGLYGYAGGLLFGMAIAIGTAWSVDYGLTMADELLNRRQYEERIRVLLDRLETDLETRWVRTARQTALPACLGKDSVAWFR